MNKGPNPGQWIREAMVKMVIQSRMAQYELDYFDNLSDDDIDWEMEGPAFMMKNRRDACAEKGIDLSHLKDNEFWGFAQEFRFLPQSPRPHCRATAMACFVHAPTATIPTPASGT